MRAGITSALGLLFFLPIRWLERRLGLDSLYRLLYACSYPRAVIYTAFRRPQPWPPLLACSRLPRTVRLARQQRLRSYMNHVLAYFQDRFAEPKWTCRYTVDGLARLRQAQDQGRPIVIATCHFGPYYIARLLGRALGVRVAELRVGDPRNRTALMARQDRRSPFPDVPPILYTKELRKMTAFLADGVAVGIAIDTPHGKQMDIPLRDGWAFRMATGAVRTAIRNRAELFPLTVIDEGFWHFRLKVGRPVPRALLAPGTDWTLAGKHILDEILPHLEARPEHGSSELMRCLIRVGECPSR